MDKEKFLQLYWRNYISIEKEFIRTLDYVTLDSENYRTFSSAYIKLILQIGSEIDIDAKLLCMLYNEHAKLKNMNDYRREIIKSENDFCNTEVNILKHCNVSSFRPWEKWTDNDNIENPDWWKVYNKIKHDRMGMDEIKNDNYKSANLRNTLYALGGLYQLLIYIYFECFSEKSQIKVPIPGSHLFELSGNRWDKITFYQDIAFLLDSASGHLLYETGIY